MKLLQGISFLRVLSTIISSQKRIINHKIIQYYTHQRNVNGLPSAQQGGTLDEQSFLALVDYKLLESHPIRRLSPSFK